MADVLTNLALAFHGAEVELTLRIRPTGAPTAEPERAGPVPETIQTPIAGAWWPLVQPGQTVQPGEVVARIHDGEAVHEIESRRAGRVVRILVEPGAAVAYGSGLLALEPLSEAGGPVRGPTAAATP